EVGNLARLQPEHAATAQLHGDPRSNAAPIIANRRTRLRGNGRGGSVTASSGGKRNEQGERPGAAATPRHQESPGPPVDRRRVRKSWQARRKVGGGGSRL